MTTTREPLAAGFAKVDRGQWHEMVVRALARSHGQVDAADVDGILGSTTDDGYLLRPIYTAADLPPEPVPELPGRPDFRRGALPAGQHTGWGIRQRYWGSAEQISAGVAAGSANGVDSCWVTLLPGAVSDAELIGILDAIDPTRTPVVVESFDDQTAAAASLLNRLGDATAAPGTSLGMDPLAQLAATGQPGDWPAIISLAKQAMDRQVLAFTIDATVYHDAGASSGEEIAAATTAGLEVVRRLTEAGIRIEDAADLLEFRFAVTDDQFDGITKLRAARLVWDRVLQVLGAPRERGQRQHAVTSWPMLTRRDPWVNLIRNTVAAFAAGVGGAESVTVLPHDMATGYPDELAQRMARNTQHLLLAESHVGVVTDPFGGSWYGETRTRNLALAAWELVQEIEGSGGLTASIDSGLLADRIERTWQHRSDRVARRADPITGVSEFPDRDRIRVGTDEHATGAVGSGGAFRRPGGGLPQRRPSEAFERLRDRADSAVAEGRQVRVYLVTVGPLARYAARVGFAENLFAAGGIETVRLPFEPGSVPELPDDHAGPVVLCLAGADRDYQELLPEVGRVLPPAAAVWLAGKPGDHAEEYAAAGVTGYLFAGCNALDVLVTTHNNLEVSDA